MRMRVTQWLSILRLRMRSLFRRASVEQELHEEFQQHLEQQAQEYVAAGLTIEEARRKATREFGGVEQSKESCRDARRVNWIQDFVQDLRYGARSLRKSFGFTAVAVLTLALGIGPCTSIFSAVNAVLLRQLPYKNADRLVLLWGTGGHTVNRDQISFTDLQDWRRGSQSFEEMANFDSFVYTLTDHGETQRVRALQVSDGYFQVMQAAPQLGRFFVPHDFEPGGQPFAILSNEFWQQKFGSDPSIVGTTITLNLHPFVIIGVARRELPSLPDSVIFRPPSQIYTPVVEPYSAENRTGRDLRGIGLLKAGVSLPQAQAELNVLVAGMQKRFPNEDGGRGVRLVTVQDDLVRNVRWTLIILQFAVLTVVLIACANVANLLLARSTARQREIAIRGALGASRARLARQVLTESVLLALAGGSLGVLLAQWSVGFLTRLGTEVLPELRDVSIDVPTLLFTTLISLLTGIVFGAVPALHFSPIDLAGSLKSGTRSTGQSSSQLRARSLLVAAEVGLSVVLLVSAGLLLRSFIFLQRVNPGFDPSHVAMTFVYPPRLQDAPIAQQQTFFRNLLARITGLHGIESAGIVSSVPDSGDFDTIGINIWGRAVPASQRPMPDRYVVSPGYFATLRIPLREGRLFNDADDLAHPRVIIVNELLAAQLFPEQDPVGQKIQIPTPGDFTEGTQPYWTIVGVVGDVVQYGLASHKTMQIYAPYTQYDCPTSNLLFRTSRDPLQFAPDVRAELRQTDGTLIAPEFAPMDQVLAGSIVEQRFSATLLTIFGMDGLLLAAMGIYGVISYLVTQRTSEFGTRVALGATPLHILALVVKQGMRPVLLGAIVGIAACFPATRIIEHLLFKTSRLDPLTFVAVGVVLIGSALLACYLPARRATRVDPMVALRYE
jgi:putative ABC transport system permease protein